MAKMWPLCRTWCLSSLRARCHTHARKHIRTHERSARPNIRMHSWCRWTTSTLSKLRQTSRRNSARSCGVSATSHSSCHRTHRTTCTRSLFSTCAATRPFPWHRSLCCGEPPTTHRNFMTRLPCCTPARSGSERTTEMQQASMAA